MTGALILGWLIAVLLCLCIEADRLVVEAEKFIPSTWAKVHDAEQTENLASARSHERSKRHIPSHSARNGGDNDADDTGSLFKINKDLAVDSLKEDITQFMDRELEWEIYTSYVILADPSGPMISGIEAYKNFFSAVRMFRSFFIKKAETTRASTFYYPEGMFIQVTWYSEWTAHEWVTGLANEPAQVSAVSRFYLDDRGLVYKHELDKLKINGQAMPEPYTTAWISELTGVPIDMMPQNMPIPGFGSAVAGR